MPDPPDIEGRRPQPKDLRRGKGGKWKKKAWAAFLSVFPILAAVVPIGALVVWLVLPPIERVQQRVDNVAEDVQILSGEVGAIKIEIGIVKDDVGDLSGDVDDLKTQVQHLEKDVGYIKGSFPSSRPPPRRRQIHPRSLQPSRPLEHVAPRAGQHRGGLRGNQVCVLEPLPCHAPDHGGHLIHGILFADVVTPRELVDVPVKVHRLMRW